jgi:tetratricopeptide (TPR) repeat protein
VGRWIWLVTLLTARALPAAGDDDALSRAAERIAAHDFEGACAALRPMARQTTVDAVVWNLLGICESELNHKVAAREAFLSALKVAPDSIPVHQNLGLLYFDDRQYEPARRWLEKAVALGSAAPGVAFSLAASEIRTGDEARGYGRLLRLEEPLRAQPAYWSERGWVELRQQSPASAAISFDRAVALAPEDVRALNGAASAAEAQHEDEKALSFLLRAKKAQPEDIRTLTHFGTLCLRKDLSVDALAALERAHKLAPANNLVLFLYAQAQIAFEQWQLAHDLFAEFDRRLPNYAPAQYALGWLDVKLNRANEARRHLEKSVALDPALFDARYELAQLDLGEGRIDDAETELKLVLKARPQHAKALIAMGDVLLKNGDLAAAIARYELAIAADRKSGPAHYKLSTVLTRLHETERAAQERALGAELNAQATKGAKTVLVLVQPDGRLLNGDPEWR